MPKVSVGLDDKRTEDVLGLVGSPSIVLSELVKNSIDSNAHIVNIYINTNDREVTVVDDGDGLDEVHIKNLGSVGESDKKEDGKEKRKDGKYYGGSKGLGLLSSFSLSDYIEIETKVDDKAYLIQWVKGQSSFDYKQIDNCELISNHGTKVTIKNIKNDDMNVLLDQDEHRKLRHITIRYFNNSEYKDKQINFYVDGKISNEFRCCDINAMDHRFVYRIKFNYISENNKLEYWFDKSYINNKINKSNLPTDNLKNHITINLSNDLKINDIIKSNYRITKTVKKDKKFSYLSSNLEDFYGQLYIIEGQSRGKKDRRPLENFGYGVKVFINDFAIYDYLDNENDWLGLGMLSQNIKNTTLRPHNVFGYVNFDKFNEKNSNLEIANERTNFIEKAPYKKFIEIMKDIVVKIAFEVDVAYRLNNIDSENYFKDLKNSKSSDSDRSNTELNLNNESKLRSDNGNIANTKESNVNGDKDSDLENENKLKPNNRDINIEEDKNNKKDNKSTNTEMKNKLIYEKNNNIDNVEEHKKNTSKIGLKNKPKYNFFTRSNVIKVDKQINIEYSELIKELKSLEYKKYYLLYNISFRSILEDISKRYINNRALGISQKFGENIKIMTEDMMNVIRNTNFIGKDDKKYIEDIIGGFHAYNNFLESVGNDFYTKEGKNGIKATKLNSFVHNPRWMEQEEAEAISNDVILPLIIISNEILRRIKQ